MSNFRRFMILAIACVSSSASFAQSPLMQVSIIGSGSPEYNPHRVSAGVLITQGDTQILVDMGDGVKRNLSEYGVDDRRMSALLFTHHHLDHNGDFAPLFVRSLLGRSDFLVAGPSQTQDFVENNLALYEQDLNYRLSKTNRGLDERINHMTVNELSGGDHFSINDINVTTLSVSHTIEAIAYRFDYLDQSIVVTGDLSSGPGVADFAKNASCMIIDSGGMIMSQDGKTNDKKNRGKKNASKQSQSKHSQSKQIGKSSTDKNRNQGNTHRAHLNLRDSSQIAGDANVDNLVYTHFLAGDIDETASKKIIEQQYQGKVVFGADLMLLDCGNS